MTVVVPTYDRATVLIDAVDSVLAQRGVELECVVVDDGSRDGTATAVQAIARRDHRVVLVERPNGGPSAARNTGIAHAAAPLVTFHDSDDLMPPGRLERQRSALDEAEVDGTFGRYDTAAVPGGALPTWLHTRPEWLAGWCWTSLLVRRDALAEIGGYDEDLRLGEDLDLIVRLRAAGRRIDPIDEVLVHRRWFGDNLTWDLDRRAPSLSTVVRRHLHARRQMEASPDP